jgi:hypothetical protein
VERKRFSFSWNRLLVVEKGDEKRKKKDSSFRLGWRRSRKFVSLEAIFSYVGFGPCFHELS